MLTRELFFVVCSWKAEKAYFMFELDFVGLSFVLRHEECSKTYELSLMLVCFLVTRWQKSIASETSDRWRVLFPHLSSGECITSKEITVNIL